MIKIYPKKVSREQASKHKICTEGNIVLCKETRTLVHFFPFSTRKVALDTAIFGSTQIFAVTTH